MIFYILFLLSGLICGLLLFAQLFKTHRRRLAWTIPFALGVACVPLGTLIEITAQSLPKSYASAIESLAINCQAIWPFFFWLSTTIFCYLAYHKRCLDTPPLKLTDTRIEMPLPTDGWRK